MCECAEMATMAAIAAAASFRLFFFALHIKNNRQFLFCEKCITNNEDQQKHSIFLIETKAKLNQMVLCTVRGSGEF